MGRPAGSVLTIEFEIEGQNFVALNGGPQFKFNESISFVVNCETQKEVDYFWEKLTAAGGEEFQCGWLRDKFGVSWQVTPTVLIDMLHDKDAEEVRESHESDASNAENRDRRFEAGVHWPVWQSY